MLTDPWKALLNVAATREAQILFDPEGWYADLQRRAKAFTWQLVAKDADIGVSWVLAENAEIVQKILSGLSNQYFGQLRLDSFVTAFLTFYPSLSALDTWY